MQTIKFTILLILSVQSFAHFKNWITFLLIVLWELFI